MKLRCAQEALADALATVGRAVPGKPTLPVLSNVLLETDGSDCVRVTATNLDRAGSRGLATGEPAANWCRQPRDHPSGRRPRIGASALAHADACCKMNGFSASSDSS